MFRKNSTWPVYMKFLYCNFAKIPSWIWTSQFFRKFQFVVTGKIEVHLQKDKSFEHLTIHLLSAWFLTFQSGNPQNNESIVRELFQNEFIRQDFDWGPFVCEVQCTLFCHQELWVSTIGAAKFHLSESNLISEIYKSKYLAVNIIYEPLADLRGGARDARPPLGVQILSFSCSFRQKFEK